MTTKHIIAIVILVIFIIALSASCLCLGYHVGRQIPDYSNYDMWVVHYDDGYYLYIQNQYEWVYTYCIDDSMSIDVSTHFDQDHDYEEE